MYTLDDARRAFQDSIPERQDAFREAVVEAWQAAQHKDTIKQWYPNEVLKLAREEARKRLEMAAARVKDLLDSGWEPTTMEPVDHALREMFARYNDMRKNAYNDLENAVAGAVIDVEGFYPPDQPDDRRGSEMLRKFSQTWVEASKQHFSDLHVYRPKAQNKQILNFLIAPRGSSAITLGELIAAGVTATTEFKSTLRMNLVTGNKDSAITDAALKAIAAFLNTGGGTLLVGISDDGQPLGLDGDKFPSEDKLMLHLVELLKDRFGGESSLDIHPTIENYISPVDKRTHRVLVVRCDPAGEPVFLDERFYVRYGPSSQQLTGKSMLALIRKRFPAS